jgi:predicted Zn-dependent protease
MACYEFAMKPTSKRTRVLLIAVALVVLAAGGAWWWSAAQARDSVTVILPPRPDKAGSAEELRARLDDAEQRARGLWRPIEGLADLARLYHANEFADEADQCERGLMQLDPTNPLWPYLQAHTLGGYGYLDEALSLLQRTIELAPDYVPARVRLGDAFLKRNEIERAAAVYGDALARDPFNGYGSIGLARTELAAGRGAAARDRLLQLVAAQPTFVPGWGLLVNVDEQLGDAAAAETHRARARDAGRPREMPDPWIDELMSYCYDSYRLAVAASAADPANNQARARQLLERAVSIAPNDDLPHRLLGNLLSDLGELSGARIYLERATVIAPKEPDNWSYLVRVLKAMGDVGAASRAVDVGLEHCPQSAVLRLERGRRFAAAGQFDRALSEFEQSRRLRPEDSSAYIEIAQTHFSQNRLEAGIAELRRADGVEPNHPVVVVLLARYAISTGDQRAALEWIRRGRAQPKVLPQDLARVIAEYKAEFGQEP